MEGSNETETELERRRAERRRKILMNQEDRFKKILGPNATVPKPTLTSAFLTDDSQEPVLPEEHLTREFLSNAQRQRQANSTGATSAAASSSHADLWKHRMYLSILGASLPLLGLNYVLIYFVLWEVGIMYMSGGGIPFPPSQTNILLTVIMVMGLKETEAQRIKNIIRISKWILTDFSYFFIALLIPQLGLNLLSNIQTA